MGRCISPVFFPPMPASLFTHGYETGDVPVQVPLAFSSYALLSNVFRGGYKPRSFAALQLHHGMINFLLFRGAPFPWD